jgi:predicted PurR-regulated permease PerM
LKLKKRLFKRLAIISVVSVLLTAVFSTTAFWFVFSDQAQEELQNYTQSLVDTYNIQGEAKFIEGYI